MIIYRMKRQDIEAKDFKSFRKILTKLISTDEGLRSLVSCVGFK